MAQRPPQHRIIIRQHPALPKNHQITHPNPPPNAHNRQHPQALTTKEKMNDKIKKIPVCQNDQTQRRRLPKDTRAVRSCALG